MRHTACVFAVLFVLAAMPVRADPLNPYDECDSAKPSAPNPCVRVDPVPQAGVKRHFVWAAAASCPQGSFNSTCSGRPDNGALVGLVGVVYEDTNGFAGLQRRARDIGGTTYLADHMVLV